MARELRASDADDRLASAVEELERYRQSVVRLNRLRNDLVAVLAHDIKGPLTSIVGFAELLEEGFLEGDAATDAARTIRTNAQRLATLANDVLALTRVEHGELEIDDERLDVLDVVRGAIELHANERTVELSANAEHAYVRGDADRLRQVFDNLIGNAIKYSQPGDRVVIIVDAQDDLVRVFVRDSGMGIPENEIAKVFERFARGSNARRAKIPGTGIGLFICKMIVERHGGEISVDSALGEGTTVAIVLPSAQNARPRTMHVGVLAADSELARYTIYELRARGLHAFEASNADELAAVLRDNDVAIVDVNVADARDVRQALNGHSGVRLVGLGATQAGGWDARLMRPFLTADLYEAIGVSVKP